MPRHARGVGLSVPYLDRLSRMTRRDNGVTGGSVPAVFCWTKFGTEAGERTPNIFRRKEIERRRNSGVFLWGIGNSIRPSLANLLAATEMPEVLFSPMKSPAAKRDVSPPELVVWCDAVGYDGCSFRIPEFSLVTSRRDQESPRPGHFALVCRKDSPLLDESDSPAGVSADEVRNLKTGSSLGASQVTSVVRRIASSGDVSYRYPVATRAYLVYPYLVRLSRGVTVPDSLRLDRETSTGLEAAMEKLVRLRRELVPESRPRSEQLMLV